MALENLQGPLTRVAAIHDISGFGKCSMTVALPVLSAAGIEVCCMPTAVLSTHTGGFEGFTYRDLTEDLLPFEKHWKSLGLEFAAVYSGFLGSPEQVAIVSEFIDDFNSEQTLIFIDPVMGDNGQLYSVFDDAMVRGMRALCRKADVLLPNMTEAAFLLDRPYTEGPYTEKQLREILEALAVMGPEQIVLTGVSLKADEVGSACFDAKTGDLEIFTVEHVPGQFHGTGDVYASFCLAGLENGMTLKDAAAFAVDLTRQCILRTVARGTPRREGVDFEGVLPEMMMRLGLFKDPR